MAVETSFTVAFAAAVPSMRTEILVGPVADWLQGPISPIS